MCGELRIVRPRFVSLSVLRIPRNNTYLDSFNEDEFIRWSRAKTRVGTT